MLQPLLGKLQFTHEAGVGFLHRVRWGRRCLLPSGSFVHQRHLERHQEQAFESLRLGNVLDGQVDEYDATIGPYPQAPARDGGFFGCRLMERQDQIVLQTFPRHFYEIVCRLTRSQFELVPSVPMNIDNLATVIDDYRRRRVTRHQHLLDQFGHRWGASSDLLCLRVCLAVSGDLHQSNGELRQMSKRARLSRPLEELPFPVDDLKEILEPADRFRGTEKQNTIRLQGVVEQWQDFLLCLDFQIDEQIAASQEVQLCEGRIGQ